MSDTQLNHGRSTTFPPLARKSGSRANAPIKEHKLSPATDLPPEILLGIVRLAVDDEPVPENTNDIPPPLPLVVSQVCHHWRTILCNDASLWTRLALSPRSISTFNVLRYLERSRALSIKLDIILPDRVPSRKFIEELESCIIPQYFDRFKEVRVYHKQCGFERGGPYFQVLGLAAFD